MPPESELQYLFYGQTTSYVFSEYIRRNYLAMSGEEPPRWGVSIWVLDAIIGNIMSFYALELEKKDSNFIVNLYKNSESSFLLKSLVKQSIYPSVNCLEYLADKSDYDLQKIAVTSCGLEIAKKLRKSQHEKVRLKAYERLGPMEYLDEMLLDKSRHVRTFAAEWMPRGYSVPTKTLSDRAYWSFAKILEKVSLDQIPMLLANKNLVRNKHLAERLQARLDSKI